MSAKENSLWLGWEFIKINFTMLSCFLLKILQIILHECEVQLNLLISKLYVFEDRDCNKLIV